MTDERKSGLDVGVLVPVSKDAVAVGALALVAGWALRGVRGFGLWWVVLAIAAVSCAGILRARHAAPASGVQDQSLDVGRP